MVRPFGSFGRAQLVMPGPPWTTRAFLKTFVRHFLTHMGSDTSYCSSDHKSISVSYKFFFLTVVTWFVAPVISKSREHYCWTRLLALFQTEHTKLLDFQNVCCSDGFVCCLVSDLFLRIDSFFSLCLFRNIFRRNSLTSNT